jgi:hypothetical protein
MKNLIFFLTGFNEIIANNNKVYNWKYLSKFYKYKTKEILWPFTYFIIFNLKDRKSIKHFIMEEKNLIGFFLYNNSLYNINFLKFFYFSLKFKANKRLSFMCISYRKQFLFNLIKSILILKKRRIFNKKNIKKI